MSQSPSPSPSQDHHHHQSIPPFTTHQHHQEQQEQEQEQESDEKLKHNHDQIQEDNLISPIDSSHHLHSSTSFPPITNNNNHNQSTTQLDPKPNLPRKQTWASLLKPEKKLANHNPSYNESINAIIRSSWLNLLLIFIPISWALHFATPNADLAIFITSMLAIIPLAKLLGFGTEEIALRVGQTLGGLLNATLGNAVELIVAILALVKCQLVVVQSSLLGSILSNLLLVLGMCFFAGGIRFSEQAFSITAAQLNSSLLIMSVIAILIPAGFHAAFSNLGDSVEGPDVLKMSRGIAVILLIIYAAYLVFQLWTHPHLYSETPSSAETPDGHPTFGGHRIMRQARSVRTRTPHISVTPDEAGEEVEPEEEEEEEVPTLNFVSAVLLLTLSTVLVGVTSEWLVDSINGITKTGAISEAWIGLILLPIVGNAAEHLTAVSVSVKDKLDLSMSVAVGSSIQIALFVVPLLVILAWILDKPLTLLFDPFESITLFLAVLVVNYTIQDGRANWIEGFILMSVYIIVAVAFYFYPSNTADHVNLGLICRT